MLFASKYAVSIMDATRREIYIGRFSHHHFSTRLLLGFLICLVRSRIHSLRVGRFYRGSQNLSTTWGKGTHLFVCCQTDRQSSPRRDRASRPRAGKTTEKAWSAMRGTESCSDSCIVEGSGKNHRFQVSRTLLRMLTS